MYTIQRLKWNTVRRTNTVISAGFRDSKNVICIRIPSRGVTSQWNSHRGVGALKCHRGVSAKDVWTLRTLQIHCSPKIEQLPVVFGPEKSEKHLHEHLSLPIWEHIPKNTITVIFLILLHPERKKTFRHIQRSRLFRKTQSSFASLVKGCLFHLSVFYMILSTSFLWSILDRAKWPMFMIKLEVIVMSRGISVVKTLWTLSVRVIKVL